VDLEEWFHICGSGLDALAPERWASLPSRVEPTTQRVLDLLDTIGIRATFFVVGWVAERHPRLIELVRASGHDIGSHSYLHQKVYDAGPDPFRSDLQRSLRVLSQVCGRSVTMFRAPEWSINDRSLWALDVLTEEGVHLDASMAPLRIVGDVGY